MVGHMERMGCEKLAKRADAQTIEGKWRRERPKLRCVIALMEKRATDRRSWRLLTENVVREKWEEEKRQWKKKSVKSP